MSLYYELEAMAKARLKLPDWGICAVDTLPHERERGAEWDKARVRLAYRVEVPGQGQKCISHKTTWITRKQYDAKGPGLVQKDVGENDEQSISPS